MMGAETLWICVVLAFVLLLVGLVVLALGLVVPLALAVAKSALVEWAARALLRRLTEQGPERAPPADGARPPTQEQRSPKTTTSIPNGEKP